MGQKNLIVFIAYIVAIIVLVLLLAIPAVTFGLKKIQGFNQTISQNNLTFQQQELYQKTQKEITIPSPLSEIMFFFMGVDKTTSLERLVFALAIWLMITSIFISAMQAFTPLNKKPAFIVSLGMGIVATHMGSFNKITEFFVKVNASLLAGTFPYMEFLILVGILIAITLLYPLFDFFKWKKTELKMEEKRIKREAGDKVVEGLVEGIEKAK